MINITKPNIKTKVVHSESKSAWNIIGAKPGSKYKVARVPYIEIKASEMLTDMERNEALKHAEFINYCFNNPDKVK